MIINTNDELPFALRVAAQIRDDIFTFLAKIANGEEVSVEYRFWQGNKLIVHVLTGMKLIQAMEAAAKEIEKRYYARLLGEPARQLATA